MVQDVYINLSMQIIILILGGILLMNWKQNYNWMKLKIMPNTALIRIKTPSKKEEEFVIRLNSTVFKRREGLKWFSYIIDPTKMFMKSMSLKEIKPLEGEKKKDVTFADLIEKESKNMTFIGKTPVLEYKSTDAQPIDVYDKETMLSSEMLEGMLIASEATADMDFFRKLFGYKDMWKIASGIALGSVAAALFGFLTFNFVNNNPLLNGQVPVCQIAAETGRIIVAG